MIHAHELAAVPLSAPARTWIVERPHATVITAEPAAAWPFLHPVTPVLPTSSPVIVWMPDLHEAFINHQTASTRLVTTEPTYLMQVWLDSAAGRDDVLIVATADRDVLAHHAPEVLAQRGPFGNPLVQVSLVSAAAAGRPAPAPIPDARHLTGEGDRADTARAVALLVNAMRVHDPSERLELCIAAKDLCPTAPALLAVASTCMEVNNLDAADRDLTEALEKAPDWAAAHFERGKLWLRVDDMERASASFREAAIRMPHFGSAWTNLGATLGELDRPEEALAAFEHVLRSDPTSHQALNNIGVVNRELGKLAESESAFRRVTQLSPDLAFGYYNLGHTLFLQGRYQAALSAYAEGQKKDPERNPVQASRLALCRLASGDAPGALNELQRAVSPLPGEYRKQLLADTNAIAWALLTHRPDLPGWKQINDWLTNELARA